MDVFSPGVAASHPTDRVGTFSVGVMVTELTTFKSEDDWGVIGVTWNKNIADIFCRELVEFVLSPYIISYAVFVEPFLYCCQLSNTD